MKVLIVGPMTSGRNSRSVMEGFVAAGATVSWVDTTVSAPARPGTALWRSIRTLGVVTPEENARVKNEVQSLVALHRPDVLVAIKTIHYDQEIYLDAHVPIKTHLSFDDVSNPDNTSPAYLEAEGRWDAVITTKRHNVAELIARGVRETIFLWGAYDPLRRRFVNPTTERQYEVGFIGVARPDRRSLPQQLGLHAGGRSVIYGPRWRRWYPLGAKGVDMRSAISGDGYTEAANDIRIGLILLNSDNRDQHTNRSFEAPACGQMVLAQRTSEHEEMFEDGKEAILFSTLDELWSSLADLAREPDRVRTVAMAGYERISRGANTYQHRAQQLLAQLAQ